MPMAADVKRNSSDINEQVLNSWLDVASMINNQRLVSYLSFNEATVCNRLWRRLGQEKDYLTQSELCRETGMEKALMNRTLRSLEDRGLIERSKAARDKRIVLVKLKEDNDIYFREVHSKSLAIVDKMIAYVGEDRARQIIEALQMITSAAKHVVRHGCPQALDSAAVRQCEPGEDDR